MTTGHKHRVLRIASTLMTLVDPKLFSVRSRSPLVNVPADSDSDDPLSYEELMCEKLGKHLQDLHNIRSEVKRLKKGPMLDIPLLLKKNRPFLLSAGSSASSREIVRSPRTGARRRKTAGLRFFSPKNCKFVLLPPVEPKKEPLRTSLTPSPVRRGRILKAHKDLTRPSCSSLLEKMKSSRAKLLQGWRREKGNGSCDYLT